MNRKHLLRALDIITEGEKRVPKYLKGDAEKIFLSQQPWVRSKGIQGFGIAKRITKGDKLNNLVLKVYVEKKLPKSKVDKRIPSQVNIPGIEGSVQIDVEEIGKIRLENQIHLEDRTRPASPGLSIGRRGYKGGTFACLVQKKGDGDRGIYLLSNAHVLGFDGDPNDPIFQPSVSQGGDSESNRIAKFSEAVPLLKGEGYLNGVDAAIAKVKKGTVISKIPYIGEPVGIRKTKVQREMTVQKYGPTTKRTLATVKDIDFKININYPGGKKFGFNGQVLCEDFTDGGDSGAAVLSLKNRIVGLHFAGTPSGSIFNPISDVFDLLDIELVTTPT
jgi:hypothetical protein